jgi:hypothetical protein
MALGSALHQEGHAMTMLWIMVVLCWGTAALLVASIAFPDLLQLRHRTYDDEAQGEIG